MSKTIILVGAGSEGVSVAMLSELKNDFGHDVIVLTETQAREQGLLPDSLPPLKTPHYEFKVAPRIEIPQFKMNDIKEQHKHDCRKGWRKQ